MKHSTHEASVWLTRQEPVIYSTATLPHTIRDFTVFAEACALRKVMNWCFCVTICHIELDHLQLLCLSGHFLITDSQLSKA